MRITIDSDPVLILYGDEGSNISELEDVCAELKLRLVTCSSADEVERILKIESVEAVVANFGSDPIANQSSFLEKCSSLFRPEMSIILLIYRFDDTTPEGWKDIDPRRVTRANRSLKVAAGDSNWSRTIFFLKEGHHYYSPRTNPINNNVTIKFDDECIPFSTEIESLLKASFSDMSSLSIRSGAQGLSGSSTLIIQPHDANGNPTAHRFFGKVFREISQARREIENWQAHIREPLPNIHYPNYHENRSSQGVAVSLQVMDLLDGPDGNPLTLYDMIQNADHPVDVVINFVDNLLKLIAQHLNTKTTHGSVDLYAEYLNPVIGQRRERRQTLESEIFDSFNMGHHWDGLSLNQRLVAHVAQTSIENSTIKLSHGDLHTGNIMARQWQGSLIPALIDFSKTSPTNHYLVDHVTLEADLLVRCIDREDLSSFLARLRRIDNDDGEVRESRIADMIRCIVRRIRRDSIERLGATRLEYCLSAFLKTLALMSYGQMKRSELVRARQYATFLMREIEELRI